MPDHDDRRSRSEWRAAPDAAGVPRSLGLPLRFLHGRDYHDGCHPHRGGPPGLAAGLEGQPVPLYRIPRDRGRDPRDQIRRGRPARRGLRSELAGPRERGDRHGESALHPEYRSRGPPTLHLKLLRSPHADARIVAIRNEAALATPGVHEIFTWEDVSRRLYTTAIHDHHLADPDDTYMLANVVRFVGQRVAAVVADSEAAAEEGCRRIEVDYEALPAVFDPEEAMQAS